ncbi:inositol 1,4,5-triphosphate receptor associated 2-like [Mercenaria mercenaria]|uniref:inositol 1,4,5-triphosphate receptor associated 2-like n=1 Tax=Mercenaria mercenaria TaxID=6596 RepID=UPI00234E5F38|nr:inositol 1,4,5-triphosphate receptor associated 2-like [Mercenaria mercenaria]
MDEEVGMSISEEEMIDSLFYRCDTLGEGKVHVYSVIQFLKNCLGNGNNEPDLLELAAILESDCTDGKINLTSYRQAVRQWVSEIRNRCESTSFLEPDGPLNSSYNLCNNSTDRSLCIETSGIGNGSFHKTEDDIGELLQELEDLKFQNRKLFEEQTQLRNQLDTQEEVTTNLTTELQNRNKDEEQLRKKIKSLQDLVDLRQSVMDENEELKTKLLSTQELKRDLDTKVVNLERENVNLESQVRNYESKWQKTCSELDLARKELQQQHNICLEHKDLLLNAQDAKSAQEEALTERNEELSALKERLNRLMEHNEKLQEEKEDVQVRLAQINGKLQRYQSKEEQLGLSDESLTGNNNGVERSKISPRLRFSTPLAKHSICMELKDRLNEDKNLPSPFCEKLELSTDVNYLNRRSVLLPTYMSAWDFEVSNGSLQDYSLELLKNRKSLSPGFYDADLEKKLESLKDLEKDGLQKEIVKLYRANLDLAEKCHRAELKEAELREAVNDTNLKHDLDKQKYHQLEDSLETSKVAREVDLKDLWKLVHNADEEDSTESESSLSTSTEQLKEQIRRDIEALRNKLYSKEKALTALRFEKSEVQGRCNKRASNSPLVEALDIPLVKIIKRQYSGRGEKCTCQCDSKVHTCNRSVPLVRKHSREDSTEEKQCCHGDSKVGDAENLNCDPSDIKVDILNNSEDVDSMHRQDIPERFKSESSAGSECMIPRNSDIDGVFKYSKSPKCQKLVDSGSGEKVHSKENQERQFVKDLDWSNDDEGIEFRKPHAGHATVHRDEGHAMLRRQSYRKAIENPESSVDEIPAGRSRSNSFQNAIEQGQVSPSNLSAAPVFTAGDTVIDTTPEYEGSDSLSLSTAPRFFSTPLSIDTVKAVQIDKKTCRNNNDVHWKDVENRELHNSEAKQQSTGLQAQLFKAGGLNPKIVPCNSHFYPLLEQWRINKSKICYIPSSMVNRDIGCNLLGY